MKTKRLLALVLSVLMLVSFSIPTVFAVEEAASTEAEQSNSIHDVLSVGANYSTVYYGGIPWRVLSKDFSSNDKDATATSAVKIKAILFIIFFGYWLMMLCMCCYFSLNFTLDITG